MTAFTNWQDEILPMVPGAEWPLVLNQLKRVVQDFYEKTLAWRVEADKNAAVDLVAGQNTYPVPIPASSVLIDVQSVFIAGREITAASPRELDQVLPGWRIATAQLPSHWHLIDHDTIRVTYTPNQDSPGALACTVCVKPSDDAAEAPDVAWERHRNAITDGTLARLMRMQKGAYPWADPSMAKEYALDYKRAWQAEANLVRKGRVRRNSVQVTPREYGFS